MKKLSLLCWLHLVLYSKMSDSKQQVYSDAKAIDAGLVAVANKAWDEEVSAATELEDDDDVPCRPSPLTRQVACGPFESSLYASKLFVKRTITQMKETPPIKDPGCGPTTVTSVWGAHKPGEWKCDVCLTRNPHIECLSCEAEKKSV